MKGRELGGVGGGGEVGLLSCLVLGEEIGDQAESEWMPPFSTPLGMSILHLLPDLVWLGKIFFSMLYWPPLSRIHHWNNSGLLLNSSILPWGPRLENKVTSLHPTVNPQ